jgi:hypothetical protein
LPEVSRYRHNIITLCRKLDRWISKATREAKAEESAAGVG